MTEIFDGRNFVSKKKEGLSKKISTLKDRGVELSLASIYLSSDPGSALYTRLKGKAAMEMGIKFQGYEIKEKDSEEVIRVLDELNKDDSISGILVQKPSGENDFSLEEWAKIVTNISPKKDVDGLSPENLGLLSIGVPRFIPATVKAVLSVLDEAKVNLRGKHVTILGASEILGRPLSMVLTDKGATVSILHTSTEDISRYTKDADVLVSATGVPGIIKGSMVKDGAVIIDVGAPKGDVVTEEVVGRASFLSPVPGGVGPVTILSLLENLVEGIES